MDPDVQSPAEALVLSLPEAHRQLGRRCLGKLPPVLRSKLVKSLTAIRIPELRVLALDLVVRRTEDPAPLIEAIDQRLLELACALDRDRWTDLIVLPSDDRRRFLQHFDNFTFAEIQSIAKEPLPITSLLALFDGTPDDTCSLCRQMKAHDKQYRWSQDLFDPPKPYENRTCFGSDLFSFDEDDKGTSLLERIGLKESRARVYLNGCNGRFHVETCTLCRRCKDDVYAYVAEVGNDRRLHEVIGKRKLKELELRQKDDRARGQWWSVETLRMKVAVTLRAIHDARQGVQRRLTLSDRDRQREALGTLKAAKREANDAAAKATMQLALDVREKWQDNVDRSVFDELKHKTIYALLQAEAEVDSRPQFWDHDATFLSSKKREIDLKGVPLTAPAAKAVFGTTPLIVVDETPALRLDKDRARQVEAEFLAQQQLLGKNSRDLLKASWRFDVNSWVDHSRKLDEAKQRQKDREEHQREERRKLREQERRRLRQLRTELRLEAQRRSERDQRALEEKLLAEQEEREAEDRERRAMCFAEADQCSIDRFWGIITDANRQRRLDELRRLIWLSRIAACNEVMRKTESVLPFFEDELERRLPPM